MKLIDKMNDARSKSVLKKIRAKQTEYDNCTKEQLQAKTKELRAKVQNGTRQKDVMVDAIALACTASCRVLGYKEVYDSQILAAIAQCEGKVTELATGEGKTLLAVLPAYFKSLTGKPVHIITANGYLAARDAKTMGPVFEELGLDVGLVEEGQKRKDKAKEYAADITYGTASVFCFDQLNDLSRGASVAPVWRCGYAIVDEIDSVLADEATSPLILTEARNEKEDSKDRKSSQNKAYQMARVVDALISENDVEIDVAANSVSLSYEAIDKLEKKLCIANLYDGSDQNLQILFYLNNALRAKFLMEKNVDYILVDQPVVVKDPKTGIETETTKKTVVLLDQNTGRGQVSKRFTEGLHEAIEARERLLDPEVQINQELTVCEKMTFQNYFKQYIEVTGMSGTVMQISDELSEIFGVSSTEIAPNKESIRIDGSDAYCATFDEKVKLVCADIISKHRAGRPVLVVTSSVEESIILSNQLKKMGLSHNLLNAKNEEKEAAIIAEAGKAGAITVATNMAGRGTDIKLGGSDEKQKEQVESLGGLYVIGFTRQEDLRLDRQIMGRAGRQGEPGETRFYVSLEDEIFDKADEEEQELLEKIRKANKLAVDGPKVAKLVDTLQRRNASIAFAIRKAVYKFGGVLAKHMFAFHKEREDVIAANNLDTLVNDMLDVVDEDFVEGYFAEYAKVHGERAAEEHRAALVRRAEAICVDPTRKNYLAITFVQVVKDEIMASYAKAKYAQKLANNNYDEFLKKKVFLKTMDENWKEHIMTIEGLQKSAFCHITAESPLDYFTRTANEEYRNLLENTSRQILMEVAANSQKVLREESSESQK